jgi:hypothetical protein
MQDTHDVDGVFSQLVENEVVWESFDRVLANLYDFGVCKTAQPADARGCGDELEGGFSSIDKAITSGRLRQRLRLNCHS